MCDIASSYAATREAERRRQWERDVLDRVLVATQRAAEAQDEARSARMDCGKLTAILATVWRESDEQVRHV